LFLDLPGSIDSIDVTIGDQFHIADGGFTPMQQEWLRLDATPLSSEAPGVG
jgi:hypothetical protein